MPEDFKDISMSQDMTSLNRNIDVFQELNSNVDIIHRYMAISGFVSAESSAYKLNIQSEYYHCYEPLAISLKQQLLDGAYMLLKESTLLNKR